MDTGAMAPEGLELSKLTLKMGAVPVRFQTGDRIYRPGDSARGWIVVTSGRVRVSLTADTGREILLYRLKAGESCLLTTSALIRSEKMIAEAVAESDVEALLVPTALFDRLLNEDAEVRREVLRNYAERVTDLVLLIQDALFHALPERLARLLLERAANGRVEATHQTIASELGTAREVVTRALLAFERDGLVTVERGQVAIVNAAALERRAASDM